MHTDVVSDKGFLLILNLYATVRAASLLIERMFLVQKYENRNCDQNSPASRGIFKFERNQIIQMRELIFLFTVGNGTLSLHPTSMAYLLDGKGEKGLYGLGVCVYLIDYRGADVALFILYAV